MNQRREVLSNVITGLIIWVLCCVCIVTYAEETGLLCVDTNANPILRNLQGDARTVVEGRRLSRIFYFAILDDEICRPIQVDKQGVLTTERPLWAASFPTNVAERSKLETVASSYRKALSLKGLGRVGAKTSEVPLIFLVGGLQFPRSAVLPAYANAMANLEAGYKSEPSSGAALLYLELAIIEKELGRMNCEATLSEAISELNLANKDFRKDVEFRTGLTSGANFDRPECAILYLAGKYAEEQAEKARAVERYTTLIERSPGSPLAWAACARLINLESTGTEVKRLKELEQMLVSTYPLIWGCPREGVKLEKTAVPNAIHALLTKVAVEIAR